MGKAIGAFSELGWEKVPNWECILVRRKQGLFLSLYVDDIKMAGKKQNMSPMWKKWMKHVDSIKKKLILANQQHFLTTYI